MNVKEEVDAQLDVFSSSFICPDNDSVGCFIIPHPERHVIFSGAFSLLFFKQTNMAFLYAIVQSMYAGDSGADCSLKSSISLDDMLEHQKACVFVCVCVCVCFFAPDAVA